MRKIPKLKNSFPQLFAQNIVGVQAMTAPIGLAFALRFSSGEYLYPEIV